MQRQEAGLHLVSVAILHGRVRQRDCCSSLHVRRVPRLATLACVTVAIARRLCADKGMQIGSDGVQLLGGHGFVKEHPAERWYRDLRAVAVMCCPLYSTLPVLP